MKWFSERENDEIYIPCKSSGIHYFYLNPIDLGITLGFPCHQGENSTSGGTTWESLATTNVKD